MQSPVSSTTDPPGPRRGRRFRAVGLVAVALLGAVVVAWLLAPQPTAPEPDPTDAASPPVTSPATSRTVSPTASPPGSAATPPGGEGLVGTYRCLTLDEATAAIERDGLDVGTVSYSIEGGAVDETWLVDVQTPAPGDPPAADRTVDLLLANPFNVQCP
jgi:hypothetical protein